MKKLTFVLALSLIVGCGAVQDWSGTYEGTSKRAASATELEAATAVKDVWKVTHNKNDGVIQILRERTGDAACTLLASHGSDNHGGYGAEIEANQKCVINGTEHILSSGELYHTDVEGFELQWKTSAEGDVVLVEQGTLTKK
ncbi:hypothetical protein BO221_40225 [Archangium sp. Cb G35]|uniref:hypothetical protein n=1 Tax=Archangium sp. Cb G35 TaxID=1920190 RepID=UPI000937E854|nr:hypothetical protein [Archangium sp. Cb G35]OJT18319.1 hypothetical protein BO221_40225 [Archangium sp. Cb G35]